MSSICAEALRASPETQRTQRGFLISLCVLCVSGLARSASAQMELAVIFVRLRGE
jgi:hypothetical protein